METRCASSIGAGQSPANPPADPARGQVLERIRRRLSREVGPQRYERYFSKQARLKVTDGCLDVTVPSRFMADLLDRRFGTALREAAFAELAARPVVDGDTAPRVPLRFNIDALSFGVSGAPAPAASQRPGAEAQPRRSADGTQRPGAFDPRYRLDNFVVGSSNRMAHTAALRLADGDEAEFRRLFIHGDCGLGKTHLLQGVAARFKAGNPAKVVRYVTGEEFTNDYITALRNNRIDEFRRRHRALDLLCVDDVHFLSTKEKTQGELLHTFDVLDLSGARLVLASDGHPRDIQRFSQQLVSRFLAGAVVKLSAPDLDTRQKIILSIARRRALSIDEEAVRLIAERSNQAAGVPGANAGSVRELEGLMTQVEAVLRLIPEFSPAGRIGPALVRHALGSDRPGPATGASTGTARPIPMHVIINQVCGEFRVEHDAFSGRGRHKRVVMARSVCAYLARSLTAFSFPEIARHMGRPTHSTVLSAAARVRARIEGSGGAEDLGPELGPEFSGLTLREVCDRLARAIRRAADGLG